MTIDLIQAIHSYIEEQDAQRGTVLLGGRARPRAEKRERLRAALAESIRFQRRLAFVPLSMIVVLFGLGVAVVIRYLGDPSRIALAIGATGISFGALIAWAIHVLRDLWRKEYLAAATLALDDTALLAILHLEIRGTAQVPAPAPNKD